MQCEFLAFFIFLSVLLVLSSFQFNKLDGISLFFMAHSSISVSEFLERNFKSDYFYLLQGDFISQNFQDLLFGCSFLGGRERCFFERNWICLRIMVFRILLVCWHWFRFSSPWFFWFVFSDWKKQCLEKWNLLILHFLIDIYFSIAR